MIWEQLKGSICGFTGTRDAITAPQRAKLHAFFPSRVPAVVHYGDCTGADYEMFLLAGIFGAFTISHPSDRDAYRMFTDADEVRPCKPYLVRNMDIVDESDYLVACPKTMAETAKGGTWMTVRYARRMGRTIAVIYPDGRVDVECPGW